MSDDNDDYLKVCIYRGNKGEQVPKSVQKLIVNEGVQVLPEKLCEDRFFLQEVTLPDGLAKIGNLAFEDCANLLEIIICNTVKYIGEGAFNDCPNLKKVEFEVSTTSPHRLQTIDECAFRFCTSLQRINLPCSVNNMGDIIFGSCTSLVEANLSTTAVTEISDSAVHDCPSLQTVSLPNTLRKLCEEAFNNCTELVAVVVPLDSQSICVKFWSFHNCRRLSNLVLPKGSTAHRESFDGCTTLHERYGEDTSPIVAGVIGRFKKFPIHRMCYDHAGTTAQELGECVTEQQGEGSLLDRFGMTPFHVLFSTVEPSIKLLEVLLDLLPNQILKCKDAIGRRPLDYLDKNWTDGTKSLLRTTLQKWMIDRLGRWASMSWTESMQSKVQEILTEDDKERRETLLNEAYSALEHYENVASTSLLEMSLWKRKLKSGWTSDGTKRQALDRENCRCLSGANIVIPNVLNFLNIPQASSFKMIDYWSGQTSAQ